jgi:hypothetical protein
VVGIANQAAMTVLSMARQAQDELDDFGDKGHPVSTDE